MTKQESLQLLESVFEQMNQMSDDELFDFMMENSQTFRDDIEAFKKNIEIKSEISRSNIEVFSNVGTFSERYYEVPLENIVIGNDEIWAKAA